MCECVLDVTMPVHMCKLFVHTCVLTCKLIINAD